jgi:predicted ATPase with chaperone activity
VSFLAEEMEFAPHVTDVGEIVARAHEQTPDFNDVKAQAHVKRALTVRRRVVIMF